MPVAYNEVQFATGTATSVGAATEITLQLGEGLAKVEILRVKVKHTGGTAATFTPRIHSATGGAANAITQEFAASSTIVAELCDVEAAGVVFTTNSAGRAFLLPVPNAGADNAFTYAVAFRVLP